LALAARTIAATTMRKIAPMELLLRQSIMV
jgi:hypothetical protein